jgi:hypothetical protein
LHQRFPLRRIRDFRDHFGEKAKHSEALDKIESADGRYADQSPNHRWADEASLPGCQHQERDAE